MKKEEIIEKMSEYAFGNFEKTHRGEQIAKNINFDIKDVKFELDYKMHEAMGDKNAEDYLLTKHIRFCLKDMYCFDITDLKNNTKTFYFYKEVFERIKKLSNLNSEFKSLINNSLSCKNVLTTENVGSTVFDIVNPESVYDREIIYLNETSITDILTSLNLDPLNMIRFDGNTLRDKIKTQLNYEALNDFIDSTFLFYSTGENLSNSCMLLVSEKLIKSIFDIDTEKISYSILFKDSFLAMIDSICKGNYIANMYDVTNPIANVIIEK